MSVKSSCEERKDAHEVHSLKLALILEPDRAAFDALKRREEPDRLRPFRCVGCVERQPEGRRSFSGLVDTVWRLGLAGQLHRDLARDVVAGCTVAYYQNALRGV